AQARPEPSPASHAPAPLPAAAVAKRVSWSDFGSGLERARAEGRPVLVTFVTSWCGYCKKMDQVTWRSAPVVDRLAELVPVRVDAEDERKVHGFIGAELAQRYGVSGFPATFVLGADGGVISRSDGFLTPAQLLQWIDRATAGQAPARAALQTAGR
ncbi:MAG TPA: thioredoxin family protein, partial [Candidatus Polarisedimenticolaceae bacterium]|nr:thioredoxin family protein [Candidatus Polarisedimenticolaceae bacterium]